MAYKQLIIARKDLGMSAGKLSAQVSHASMAFFNNRHCKTFKRPKISNTSSTR